MNQKRNIFFMSFCLLWLVSCGSKQQDMPDEKYKTLTVTTADQTLQSSYPAVLRGRQAVEVRPQVSGTITDICIKEGDIVRQGQVLFVIDQVPYKAALETALASVKSAEAKLQTALLTAESKEALVTVSDDSEVYAYFTMAENQMLDLIGKYGSLEEACDKMPAVRLTLSNGQEYMEPGRVDAISGIVDESTGGVTLRAVFANKGHLLRNGGSGVVAVPVEYKDCIIIPQSATYELQNRVFAWKVVDGKTQSAPITIHKYNDGQTYIVLSGLQPGDVIVAEGAGLMREGTVVDVAAISEPENK